MYFRDWGGSLVADMPFESVKVNDDVLEFSQLGVLMNLGQFKAEIMGYADEASYKAAGYSGNRYDLLTEIAKMEQLVSRMTTEQLEKILMHMPHDRNGKVHCARTPLYMTGFTYFSYGAYSIELAVLPVTVPLELTPDDELSVKEKVEKGKYWITFDIVRLMSKTDVAIIDRDMKWHKLEFSRKKYLKQDEIISGHTYDDGKGTTYLYIGEVSFGTGFRCLENTGVVNDYTDSVKLDSHYGQVYLALTDELVDTLSKMKFAEWLEQNIRNEVNHSDKSCYNLRDYNFRSFKCSLERESVPKFVAETGTIYDASEMKCSLDALIEKPVELEKLKKLESKNIYSAYTVWRVRVEVLGE